MIKFILKYNLSLYNILAIIWLSIQILIFYLIPYFVIPLLWFLIILFLFILIIRNIFLVFKNSRNLQFTERIIDRKSTRLNSSHVRISYAVFCLKKKKNKRVS